LPNAAFPKLTYLDISHTKMNEKGLKRLTSMYVINNIIITYLSSFSLSIKTGIPSLQKLNLARTDANDIVMSSLGPGRCYLLVYPPFL